MNCAGAIGTVASLTLFSGLLLHAQTPASHQTDLGKQTPGAILRVGGTVSPPRVISSPDPEYSDKARTAGYAGVCVLWLVVDNTGKPRDIRVARSIGMGLDEKAIEAVRSWRFKPAMKDGAPVAAQINVEISFQLSGGAADEFQKISQKADAGDAKAQFELSRVFLSSHDPSDESRGLSYLEKAAKQGMPKAQFEMGAFLSSRRNDFVNAYVWFALAHRSRYKHSDKRMNDLANKMTGEQLAEARHRLGSNNPF